MSSQEEKTNRINTLILRKIADKFKIPHENLPILAISEKKSSEKYLQAYKTFFEKIFKPDDILKPVSPSDPELNLIDIIKNLFSGTIILNPAPSGTPISVISTPPVPSVSGNGTTNSSSVDTSTDNSSSGIGLSSSSSVDTSTDNSSSGIGLSSSSSVDTSTDNSSSGIGLSSSSYTDTSLDNSLSGIESSSSTSVSALTETSESVNRPPGSSSVGTSTETDSLQGDQQPVTVNTKTSTTDTGDNVVIETKFDKTASIKYLNYDAKEKKIIMTDKPKKSV